ncbi:MAG: hypothetical protein GQE15_06695 [Archangiaceae bacterium]|nr:hypothetical protein [Archangiaceae bacterium]
MKSFLLCLVASTTLAAPDLEVHEWGTFTSISDGNGVATKWLARSEDLPAFVYHSQFGDCRGLRSCIESFESKSRMRALVRMETPVIYFYTPTPMDVSLKVGFPNGRMTEWYPAVWNSTPHLLDWGTFRVDPTKNPVLPKESSPNHYYAAREVDAAPVLVRGREFSIDGAGCQNRQFEFTRGRSGEFCVTTKQTEEWERYLFYRGVGDFEPLVNATLTKTEVFVRPTRALGHALLFERRGESVGLTPLPLDGKAQAIRRPALSSTPQDVRKAMVALLLETGLFEKEALAMVKTWDDSWFTEGVRVFYVVPRAKTDELLPLTISPAPKKLVRTIIGRLELLTPEQLAAMRADVLTLTPDADPLATIEKLKAKHGRFTSPLLERIQPTLAEPLATTVSTLISIMTGRTEGQALE